MCDIAGGLGMSTKSLLFEHADTEDASEPEMVKVDSEDPARNG